MIFHKSTSTMASPLQVNPSKFMMIRMLGCNIVPHVLFIRFAQCADKEDWTSINCTGLRVCVNSDTTTIEVARERFFPKGVLVEKSTAEQAMQGLVQGECNVIIGPIMGIVEPSLRDLGFEGEYKMGSNRFSKDPLAMVTRQDDPQFSAFVKWIVSAIFYAEEEGINNATSNEIPLVSLFGTLHGRMLKDVIQAVGNYEEIYSNNLEDFVPRAGLNRLSVNPYGPRHYPLPGI